MKGEIGGSQNGRDVQKECRAPVNTATKMRKLLNGGCRQRKMYSSLNVLFNGNICYQEKNKNADNLEYIPKYFSLPA